MSAANTPTAGTPQNPPLKLDYNERSEGPPEWVRAALTQIPDQAIWRYEGRGELEQALANRFGLEPEWVLATNGGDEAIALYYAALQRAAQVLVPQPSFGFYTEQAVHWPLEVTTLEALPDLAINLSRTSEWVAKHKPQAVVIVRPNNPTGEWLPQEKVEALLEVCGQAGTTLWLDEAYAEFAPGNMAAALARYPQLIILRTFSKAHGLAGLRVGYLLGHPHMLAPMRERALPYNLSAVSMWLARRALQADALSDMGAYAAMVQAQRERIRIMFLQAGIAVIPGKGNFLCPTFADEVQAACFAEQLERQGLQVRRFQRTGLTHALRITIPAYSERLFSAVQHALADLQRTSHSNPAKQLGGAP